MSSGTRASLDPPVLQSRSTAVKGTPEREPSGYGGRPYDALSQTEAVSTVQDSLTEAVEDVVKVVKIVVALLHLGLIAHCVIDESVGVGHRAGADEGDKEGRRVTRCLTAFTGTSTETEVCLGVSLPFRATHILPHAPLLGMSATCRGGGGGGERWGPPLPSQAPLGH